MITFDARDGLWLTVVGGMVFSVARVLAMEVLDGAMLIVDDWMEWLMCREQRGRWSEVRLVRGRAVVKAKV